MCIVVLLGKLRDSFMCLPASFNEEFGFYYLYVSCEMVGLILRPSGYD